MTNTAKASKPRKTRATSSRSYRATVNIEYPTSDGHYVHVAAGELAENVPSDTVKPWLDQGILEEVAG